MCIDVEGGEEEVLKSMDWDIPVYIVCIELDDDNKEKDENCRQRNLSHHMLLVIQMDVCKYYSIMMLYHI